MFKTVKGLILRRKKFGDAHAYITALTEEGIIIFTAYGILSPKSKNFAGCQPYTLSEFVLNIKGELLTLSQASPISYLIRQGIEFERLALANYIVSMSSETTLTPEDARSIYSLTCTALTLTDRSDVPSDIIKAVFELRLSAALGFLPELENCVLCGEPVNSGIFSVSDGGLICGKCAIKTEQKGTELSKTLVSALRHMVKLDDRQAFGIRFSDPAASAAFFSLAERFSSEHLGCAKTALNYYRQNTR